MSDALLCVKSGSETMSDCPCSPDVGDCNRCGMKYPPETMSGKPPIHEKIPLRQMPGRFRDEAVKRLAEAKQAMREGDTARANQIAADARAYAKEVKQEGVAKNYTRRTGIKQPLGMEGGKTRRNRTSGGDIVSHLLTIRNQVKLYHWQTGSFARHTATDNLTTALDTNIDAFVESYMGRYGRPKVSGSIKLHNFSESAARAFVAKETKYLSSELPRKIGKNDTDLLNLRDTILGDLTKVLYLFTLA